MKLGFTPQGPLEWLAIVLDMLPVPLGHTHVAVVLARAVLDANRFGIFKALDRDPKTIAQLAADLELHPRALTSLITCLAPAGYFRFDGTYVSLAPMARRWLAPSSTDNLNLQIQLNERCWEWMSSLGDFLRTGEGLRYHETFTEADWRLYQDAMAAGPGRRAADVARRLPMPAGATTLLDIGGGHGRFSAEICRRFPALQAVILDLPEAIAPAAEILAAEGLGDRVQHKAGNALTTDLGEALWDFVLCANLVHHFSADDTLALSHRVAHALRPGGYFAILDFVRPPISAGGDQIGGALDLFFSLSSNSGTWSLEEMQYWQAQAGLVSPRVQTYMAMPGFACVIARKP